MSDEKIIDGSNDQALEEAKKSSVFELTKEEYYDIVNKVLEGDPQGYELLIKRARMNLLRLIQITCSRAGHPSVADDAMQETTIKIYTYFVTHYVYVGDSDEINPDYRGLSAWMKAIALNATKDEIAKQNRYYVIIDWDYCGADESEEEEGSGKTDIPSTEPGPETRVINRIVNVEDLRKSVDTVLSSRNAVYKVLTWLGHRLLVYKHGYSNIEANRVTVERFRDMTFFEIYDFIMNESRDIEWLVFTSEQKKKISNALCKEVDGRAMGNHTLSEMFMAKGEEETISDWRNRLDKLLKGNVGTKTADEEETK